MTETTDRPIPGRHNMYDAIHRGLRFGHGQLIRRLGSTDFANPTEAETMLAELRAFLRLAHGHLESEEAVIHPEIEMAEPGATDDAHEGHEDHERSFLELETLCDRIDEAQGDGRAALGRALYRRYCLFAAADIAHMDGEEHELLGRMHRLFTDDELRAIEGTIVARSSPDKMMGYLRLILPAISAPERVGMLCAMRHVMPPVVFQLVMSDAARPALEPAAYVALETELKLAA